MMPDKMQLHNVREMSVLFEQTHDHCIGSQGKREVFGHEQPQQRSPEDLPLWDDALPQRLLYDLCDAERPTVASFGPTGMSALEQKAAEIHYTAVEGLDKGTLIADIEQTTWDAAETLAWLGESTHKEKVTIPHRDADATVPERSGLGTAFWNLDGGDLTRWSEYDSVMMRRAIAEGKDLYGQHFTGDEEIPKFALRLATATVDYIWTVQGRSVHQKVRSAS